MTMKAYFRRKPFILSVMVGISALLLVSAALAIWPEFPYGGTNGNSATSMYVEWKENFFKQTGTDYSYLPSNWPNHGSDNPREVGYIANSSELETYFNDLQARSGGVMKWRNVYQYNAVNDAGVLENPIKTIKLPLIVFSKEGIFEPEDVKELGRPIVWIQGEIHGNESTGSESMQVTAHRLAVGDLKYILDKVVVVILPRFNDEGAWRWQRGNNSAIPNGGEAMQDPNRDHMYFEQLVVRAVHKTINAYNPHVFLDQHEMNNTSYAEQVQNASGNWVSTGSTTDYTFDLSICHTPNPALSKRARDLGYNLFEPQWRKDLDDKKVRWTIYTAASGTKYETGLVLSNDMTTFVEGRRRLRAWILECDADPRQDPNYAQKGGWSVLTETPSNNRPRGQLGMRTYSHNTFVESLLKTTYNNASYVKEQIELGRDEMIEKGKSVSPANTLVLGYTYNPLINSTWTNVDACTASTASADLFPEIFKEYYITKSLDVTTGDPVTVEFFNEVKYGRIGQTMESDKFGFVPASVIAQPYAYIIKADQAMIDRLSHTGVYLHRLTEDKQLQVSAFRVNKVNPRDNNGSIYAYNTTITYGRQPNPFAVECDPAVEKTVAFPKGTYVMYMAQVRAPLGAMALDPESCYNYSHIWSVRRERALTGVGSHKGYEGLLPVGLNEDFPVYRLMNVVNLPTEALPDLNNYRGAETPHALPVGDEAPFLKAVSSKAGETLHRALDLIIPNDGIVGEIVGGKYKLTAEALRNIYRAMGGDGRIAADVNWFFLSKDGKIEEVMVNNGEILLNMDKFGFAGGTNLFVRMAATTKPVSECDLFGCNAASYGYLVLLILGAARFVFRKK